MDAPRRSCYVAQAALSARLVLSARSGSDNGPERIPVPSGKERCANKAVIDLLVATSAHQVLAGAVLTTGSARAAAVSRRRLLLYGTSSLPPAKYGGCFAADAVVRPGACSCRCRPRSSHRPSWPRERRSGYRLEERR